MYNSVFSFATVILLILASWSASGTELTTTTDMEIQEVLRDMSGQWMIDVAYFADFLRSGSELQKRWCGYGWSATEIEKRHKVVRADPGITAPYTIRNLGGDSIEIHIGGAGPPKTIKHSQCTKISLGMYSCQSQDGTPFVFRYDGTHIYYMFRFTPSMMDCKLVSSSPAEVWLAYLRLQRSP